MAVDLDNLFDGRRLKERRRDALLDAEDDAVRRGDADGGGAELDGLERVLDLEEAAFGGEGVDAPVWGAASAASAGGAAQGAAWRGVGGEGSYRIRILP